MANGGSFTFFERGMVRSFKETVVNDTVTNDNDESDRGSESTSFAILSNKARERHQLATSGVQIDEENMNLWNLARAFDVLDNYHKRYVNYLAKRTKFELRSNRGDLALCPLHVALCPLLFAISLEWNTLIVFVLAWMLGCVDCWLVVSGKRHQTKGKHARSNMRRASLSFDSELDDELDDDEMDITAVDDTDDLGHQPLSPPHVTSPR